MSKNKNADVTAKPQSDPDQELRQTVRNHLLFALFLALLVVGGIGGWATFTEISGAVVSSGTIVVETNTKHVQHREGGIVRQIRVKNGDTVEAGDLLISLDDTVTRANLAVITKQLTELTAQEYRLEAERDDLPTIDWPEERKRDLGDIERGQQLLLEARRNSKDGRKNQLEEQIRQFNKQTEGLQAQVDAKDSEIELIDEELADLGGLLNKQLVSKSRVTGLRREKARLSGEYGDLIAQIARTKEAISERRIQILQIEESYRAEVLEQLQEVRSRIAQLEEQKIAAEDELTRVDILAPRNGYVHQLSVHTIGGVIAPGETVMQIVPREDQLIVETQVRPVDIDQMSPGQKARIRFPSFDQRTTPELTAQLLTVSADLNEDERTGNSYYVARLLIDEEELSKLGEKVLVPGMPVETFLQTGDRTVLSYLVKPVTDQIAHALREQ
ncbi:HlyD family type I secretion periplasmic adaptor subunit [Roseibium sediminicola]|uniref:Membrane fusion protein (MFP) family protein n=1 Tax=Roseibium sediminicola TaxID=2933272 RepID=A0ABT0GQE2_9HYPH|nr:HlyD family type I secretion periplasmic adaptor subunit [Roseibium sp. CAU 1639]MCK7611322.1 HlyD family type I secretion periplasmic adaptor subunit [Roseibium sp. CAU 1639]